jgi:MFS transporter, DHA1 family, inner membrane transport protein
MPGAAIDRREGENLTIGIMMFGVLLASYAINAMDRQVFPLILPEVRKEYGFDLAAGGLLSTIFTLGMAVAGIPTGWLLARYTRRFVVSLGIFIFSVGTGITVISHGFADMLFYRAATGIGEAMQITALIAIASNYFTSYRSSAVGALSFTYGIGAIVGPLLAGYLLTNYQSWRAPMVGYGLLGGVAIIAIYAFVRPWFSEGVSDIAPEGDKNVSETLFNRNVLVLMVLAILWGLTLQSYFGLYPTYLRESLKFTSADAATLMSCFGIGGLTSIGGGWLGDRFSAKALLSISFFIASIIGYLLFHTITGFMALAAAQIVWGAVGGGTLFVNVASYFTKAVQLPLAGRAAGLFVTVFYGAGAVSGYILGLLVSNLGWQTAAEIQIVGLPFLSALICFLFDSSTMLAPLGSGSPGDAPAARPVAVSH